MNKIKVTDFVSKYKIILKYENYNKKFFNVNSIKFLFVKIDHNLSIILNINLQEPDRTTILTRCGK